MKKISINVRVFGIAILFLLYLSWFVPSVWGQNNTISGYVFDSQRNRVSQIPVELMNDVNSVIARVKTDGSGRFFFTRVPSGRLSIRVLPLGTDLEGQTQEIEITSGDLRRPISENAQIDFYLRLRKNNNAAITNGVVFAQEVPDEAKKMYEKAVSDLSNKRVDLAVTELENALKLFPAYYLALERLGLEYISQQKYKDARDILSRAVSVNSRSFSSWYGLSYANYALKQAEAAVEAAKNAVSLNSSSVEALLFLGISQRQAKQYEDARKSLKKAEKLSKGNSPDVHWHLALLYAHNFKLYKDAADELELYLKVSPNASNAEAVKKLIKQFRENPIPSN